MGVMKKLFLIGLAVALSVWLIGSSGADEGKDESGKGRRAVPEKGYHQDRGDSSYFQRHGYGRLNIPKGHYPAPGECRIWYPDLPPGQQPPPGDCEPLWRTVPPGAWLIRHPEDDLNHVHVVVYDDHRPGIIRVIGEFEIASGVFVRVILDR